MRITVYFPRLMESGISKWRAENIIDAIYSAALNVQYEDEKDSMTVGYTAVYRDKKKRRKIVKGDIFP